MTALHDSRRNERGFTLVVAVFLLVVLAGLGAFAVRLTLMQQQTVSSGLLASQAFHAARTGIAWAAHQAINGGACTTSTVSLSEGGTAGFDVDVSCAQSTHIEAGASMDVFVIEALAYRGSYGEPDYVSRRIEAKIVDGS